MKVYHLPGRTVLEMEGADVEAVLQSTVTNNIESVQSDAVYTALLTPQGKYLFDFFVLRDSAERWLIDVATDRADALAQRLKMYCLRRDARISGKTGLQVTLVWGGEALPDISKAMCVRDPRSPALGWRLYSEEPIEVPNADQANLSDYEALRVAEAVPESGIELTPDDSYILEAGFERLNGVDFRKGCYVGQEVTARMKHKTELKKRLVSVEVKGSAAPGTPITSNGKPAGTLFTQANGRGLAHLRLDRAKGTLIAGDAELVFPS